MWIDCDECSLWFLIAAVVSAIKTIQLIFHRLFSPLLQFKIDRRVDSLATSRSIEIRLGDSINIVNKIKNVERCT